MWPVCLGGRQSSDSWEGFRAVVLLGGRQSSGVAGRAFEQWCDREGVRAAVWLGSGLPQGKRVLNGMHITGIGMSHGTEPGEGRNEKRG